MAGEAMRQMAYDECHEGFTRLRDRSLSLTVFNRMLYFAGHECIGVVFKRAQTGMGTEVVPQTLILGAGIIRRITQCTATCSVEFWCLGVCESCQILFPLRRRSTRKVPHAEKKDYECNTKETRKKNRCRLKVEPILSNRPKQDDTYQKGQNVGNSWWVSFFTIHLSALLHSRIMTPLTNSCCQPEPKDRGDHDTQYDSAKDRKDL
jgi:hypothetical protein